MSTSRARSLSERLDREGAESVLRKAKDIGGDAVDTARGFVALQDRLDKLREAARKTESPEDKLADLVTKTESRLAEEVKAEDAAAWRKPPFPQTEEETKAMADELSPGEGGEKEAVPAPAKSAKEPEPTPAPAVKRAKEAAKSDSGVVNLKALAEDYYRTKAAREAQTTGKLTAAAVAGASVDSVSPKRKKQPIGAFIAIAAGLIAVCGVLVYLLMSRNSGDESDNTARAPAGSTVAAAPSVMSAEPAPAPAVELPPPPDDNASAGELERYRAEVEQLKAQLAQEQVEKAAPSVAPEAVATDPAQGPTPGAATQPTQTTKSPGTSRTGSTAPRTGSTSTASRDAGTAPPTTPPPSEGTTANPLISMLGGRPTQGTGTSGSTSTPGGTTGTTAPSTEGGGRVVGSLSDLGITNPHPAEPTAPTAPATPAAVAPPPPPPPEENLPETLGRPEIRRGTESVKSSVLGCGSGNTGTITVEFTVSGTNGGVTNARVTGEFAGTAIGACAESAARNASFARFRRSTFTFTFPFVLPIQ